MTLEGSKIKSATGGTVLGLDDAALLRITDLVDHCSLVTMPGSAESAVVSYR